MRGAFFEARDKISGNQERDDCGGDFRKQAAIENPVDIVECQREQHQRDEQQNDLDDVEERADGGAVASVEHKTAETVDFLAPEAPAYDSHAECREIDDFGIVCEQGDHGLGE